MADNPMDGMEEKTRLEFDLDKDGTPDIVIKDTNGHSIYVNVRWLIAAAGALCTAVIAWVMI